MEGIVTHCEHCSTRFEAPKRSAGGFANCVSCGLATEVPGGTDTLWVVLRVLAAAAAVVAIALAYLMGGPEGGFVAFCICAVIAIILRLSL